MKTEINSKENQIIFRLNTKTYPLEAIYSTAYVFLDRAYIFLDGDPKKEIVVYLKGKEKLNSQELENLKGEFCNELLNYLLRKEIAKANQKIREIIIGAALISALPNPESLIKESVLTQKNGTSQVSYKEDPFGIRENWKKAEK